MLLRASVTPSQLQGWLARSLGGLLALSASPSWLRTVVLMTHETHIGQQKRFTADQLELFDTILLLPKKLRWEMACYH